MNSPAPPSLAPSWEVHIARSRPDAPVNSILQTQQYWAAYGFGVKQLVSLVWRVRDNRVVMDQSDDLYDVALVPPHQLTREEIYQLVREALQKQLGINVVKEKRSMEVAVLTAPHGKGLDLHQLPDENRPKGVVTTIGRELVGTDVTIADLCEFIEQWQQVVAVDETNLKGHYSFNVKGNGDLHKLLKEHLGLVVTREKREIEVLRIDKL